MSEAEILAFDRALAEGGEGLPHAFMVRLAGGENPLRVFRDWRGLTQQALADASGVNRMNAVNDSRQAHSYLKPAGQMLHPWFDAGSTGEEARPRSSLKFRI